MVFKSLIARLRRQRDTHRSVRFLIMHLFLAEHLPNLAVALHRGIRRMIPGVMRVVIPGVLPGHGALTVGHPIIRSLRRVAQVALLCTPVRSPSLQLHGLAWRRPPIDLEARLVEAGTIHQGVMWSPRCHPRKTSHRRSRPWKARRELPRGELRRFRMMAVLIGTPRICLARAMLFRFEDRRAGSRKSIAGANY